MKKLLLGLTLLVSFTSFAGGVNVHINQLNEIPISVDEKLELDSIKIQLRCLWYHNLATMLKHIPNNETTDFIDLDLYKQDGKYLASSNSDLKINGFRLVPNDHCSIMLHIDTHDIAQPEVKRKNHYTFIKFPKGKRKGDLTDLLINELTSRTIKAKYNYTNRVTFERNK